MTMQQEGGVQKSRRRPKIVGTELYWVTQLAADHAIWAPLLHLPEIESVDVEYQISPSRTNLLYARRFGYPRVDAILRHAGGEVTLLEAKLETSPQAIMGAVGQLLYYKTVLENTEKVTVSSLVVAAPNIPGLVGSMLEQYSLPIRLLIVQEDKFEALVPSFEWKPREQ